MMAQPPRAASASAALASRISSRQTSFSKRRFVELDQSLQCSKRRGCKMHLKWILHKLQFLRRRSAHSELGCVVRFSKITSEGRQNSRARDDYLSIYQLGLEDLNIILFTARLALSCDGRHVKHVCLSLLSTRSLDKRLFLASNRLRHSSPCSSESPSKTQLIYMEDCLSASHLNFMTSSLRICEPNYLPSEVISM